MTKSIIVLMSCLVCLMSVQAMASDRYLYFLTSEQDQIKLFNLNMEPLYKGITGAKTDTLVCAYKDTRGNTQSFELGYNPCDDSTSASIMVQAKNSHGDVLNADSSQVFQDHKSLWVNAHLSVGDGNVSLEAGLDVMSATNYIISQKKSGHGPGALPSIDTAIPVTRIPSLLPGNQGAGTVNCGIEKRQYECAN